MAEELPSFKYQPDPVGTGSVVPSETACLCCGRVRGFIYVGPVYSEQELNEQLCPWCIADGSAAAKYGASFVEGIDLEKAGIEAGIVSEVRTRTPSYIGWQQEAWLSHCGDACAFQGNVAAVDVDQADPATKLEWMKEYGLSDPEWANITDTYKIGGDVGFYKFECRHCGTKLLAWDCA